MSSKSFIFVFIRPCSNVLNLFFKKTKNYSLIEKAIKNKEKQKIPCETPSLAKILKKCFVLFDTHLQ